MNIKCEAFRSMEYKVVLFRLKEHYLFYRAFYMDLDRFRGHFRSFTGRFMVVTACCKS